MNKFYAQRKLCFGCTVKYKYYNTYTKTKGRKIVTVDVCSICYLKDNILDKVEPMMITEVVGMNTLTV